MTVKSVKYPDSATLADLNAHKLASSGTHGVVGTFVGTTDAQTLSNKTISSATSIAFDTSGTGSAARSIYGSATKLLFQGGSAGFTWRNTGDTADLMLLTNVGAFTAGIAAAAGVTDITHVFQADGRCVLHIAGSSNTNTNAVVSFTCSGLATAGTVGLIGTASTYGAYGQGKTVLNNSGVGVALDAYGVSGTITMYTGGGGLGAILGFTLSTVGAMTVGRAVTNNYNGVLHTINGSLMAGNVTSTDQSGEIMLSNNCRVGAATAEVGRSNTTTGGCALVLDNRTSDSSSCFKVYANQTSDATSTNGDIIASATQAGAWVFGVSGLATTAVLTANGSIISGAPTIVSQIAARGTGQDTTTTFDQAGTMGGVLFLQGSANSVGTGGGVMFGANNGAFACVKGQQTSGSNNTSGDIAFYIRPGTADATMTLGGLLKYDGSWTLPLIHFTSTPAGNICSGTYTPTFTSVTNCEATPVIKSGSLFHYMRIGNHVRVWGVCEVNPTSDAETVFGISLPIASNFAEVYAECSGSVLADTGTYTSAQWGNVGADTTNDRATVDYFPGTASNHTVYVKFDYEVK